MPVHSSLASPDSETQANSLVLVSHSATEDLLRLEEMKISTHHPIDLVVAIAATDYTH